MFYHKLSLQILKLSFCVIFIFFFLFYFTDEVKATQCVSWQVYAETQSGGNWVPFSGCADNTDNNGNYIIYYPGQQIYTSGGGGYVWQADDWSCIGLYAQIEPYSGYLAYLINPICFYKWSYAGGNGSAYLTVPSTPGTHYLQFNACVVGWTEGCARWAWSPPLYFMVQKPKPTINYFNASWNPLPVGNTSTLQWSTNNTDYVIIYGYGTNGATFNANGSYPVYYPYAGAYDYTLYACSYYWGCTTTRSLRVNVAPGNFTIDTSRTKADCEFYNGQHRAVNRIFWNPSAGAVRYVVNKYNTSGTLLAQYNTTNTYYYDRSVNYGDKNYYTVLAYNAQGYSTLSSNTSGALNALYCIPPEAIFEANPMQVERGKSSTLSWSTNYVNSVSISNGIYSWTNPDPIHPTSNSGTASTGPLTQQTTYTLTASNPCPTSYSPCANNPLRISRIVRVATDKLEGAGDIYSGNILNDQSGKIMFDKRSVLSAKSNITVYNPNAYPWQIPQYNYVLWGITKNTMMLHKNNLVKNAKTLPPNGGDYQVRNNTWFLAKGNDANPTVGNDVNPPVDGKVWYIKGNLTLVNVKFQGKGTIIVDGKLTIKDDISYDTSTEPNNSLGFIVMGDVDIEREVDTTDGAIFSFGTIHMK